MPRQKRLPVLLVEALGDEFGEADVVHGGEELAIRHILLRRSCGWIGRGLDEERSLEEEAPTLHVWGLVAMKGCEKFEGTRDACARHRRCEDSR